jgi:acyl-CoA synthetase (AMP-forming)/AMP-acid ligase II
MASSVGFASLVDCLRDQVARRPDVLAFAWLDDGENESGRLTFAELDREVRVIAALLVERRMSGERVLILLPPGLDLVKALYACLYANAVAVTTALPSPRGGDTLARMLSIAKDSRPKAIFTTPALRETLRSQVGDHAGFREALWLTGGEVDVHTKWRDAGNRREDLAFLQYTSGSTATPRGVMISHGNLVHNLEYLRQAFDNKEGETGVSWLPLHHDMGLIGCVFEFAYTGMSTVLMSPLHFIQRPVRWLRAVSKYRAHTSGAPNFAYDLCVRKAKPEQCEGLDLSHWKVAFNGSEPISATTLERFADRFAPLGFRPEALHPCYGLAECTLFVSGSSYGERPVTKSYKDSDLIAGRTLVATENGDGRKLVSSGQVWGHDIAIVDPETGVRSAQGQIGEIWLSGPSVCMGYWEQPEPSEAVFRAGIAGEPEAGSFLRTGDFGFLDEGELFVTGRIKDLIIIACQNHYPQDIELTVQEGLLNGRPGACAAVGVDVEGEEGLVILVEVRKAVALTETVKTVRRLVAAEHDLRTHDVALVRPGTLRKTTSGKIRRHASRADYLEGRLIGWGTGPGGD